MTRKPVLRSSQIAALEAISGGNRVSYALVINTDGLHEDVVKEAEATLGILGAPSSKSNLGLVVQVAEFPTDFMEG